MRLLERRSDGTLILRDFPDGRVPDYAILSHTWSINNDEEVTFQDLETGSGRTKPAWTRKISFCADRASADGLNYLWIDTCCIKKSSDAELTEALNSMFRWYQRATKCYVSLSDVSVSKRTGAAGDEHEGWEQQFQRCRWLTRGWTLQELLAPLSIEFFDRDGFKLGDKRSLEGLLSEMTRIPVLALRGADLSGFTVAERMSWAEGRRTKREEDGAYSLLGIFNAYIPLIYGEGRSNAFSRLREQIEKSSRIEQDTILDNLPYAADAPFNIYQRQHESVCLPDTRVDLLRDIYDWADSRDGRSLFWLNGLAGTGKSTIARTVARTLFDKRRLGASFFFSRGGGEVSHADKFVTTIAAQLATSIPGLRRHMCDAIQQGGDAGRRTLRDQWDELIIGPLSKVNRGAGLTSYVIVVDALDECTEATDIRTLLHLFRKARPSSYVRLQIFLTSRPELPIRYEFSRTNTEEYQDCVLHNIEPATVDDDIYRFLHYNFDTIRQERQLSTDWPGEAIISKLVKIASGLFIWAATACRFIREGRRFAPKRLEAILRGSQTAITAPEKHLDEIYTTVLRQTISLDYTDDEKDELCAILRRVLGSIATLFSPLCVAPFSALIKMSEIDTKQTLDELHSILDIPKDESRPLRLHHPSFRDFLLNHERCTDINFRVDERGTHSTLADQCREIMAEGLAQDLCRLNSPDSSVDNVSESGLRLSLPVDVQYACLYWVHHLQKSEPVLEDDGSVHKFLQLHFLHWLEALVLMRKVSEAIHAVEVLKAIPDARHCPRLTSFVHDAWRFAVYCRPAFETRPLQLYCSALLFAPAKSVIRRYFEGERLPWIRRLPQVREDWDALLQTVEGRGLCHAMAFSSDSKSLAAASDAGLVQVWDAASGIERFSFQISYHGYIASMAFSPNDQTLALATNLGAVSLRDPVTGLESHKLLGHQARVDALVFSSDSKLLASGSHDRTVKLWDVTTGIELHTLRGHETQLTTIAFIAGNQLLATASKQNSCVKLWNVRTGDAYQTLGPFYDEHDPMTFSPDGRLLAVVYLSIIRLCEIGTGDVLQVYQDHEMVQSMAISPEGNLLASASFGTVTLYPIGTSGDATVLDGHRGWVFAVLFSPDGKMIASSAHDETIKLWDAQKTDGRQSHDEDHTGWINAISFSSDGKLLASASHDNTVKLWDVAQGRGIKLLGEHKAWVSDLAFSPDGQLLATAGDNTVKLWETSSSTEKRVLEGQDDWITHVAFSPNGKLLASISIHKTVKVWDVDTGALKHSVGGERLRLQSPLSYSLTNGEGVKVWFANASRFDVMMFWLDNKGVSKYYWTLYPGQMFQQSTYVGHFWRLVEAKSKQTIGGYCGTHRQVDVTITDADVEAIQGNKEQLQRAIESHGWWRTSSDAPNPEAQPHLALQDNWVIDNTRKRLVWLPDEYRPTFSATHADAIALGHASGRVTMLEIDRTAIT